jgi:hypothetical protein
MKQCSKCSVDLVVGDNWTASNAKQKAYICKECKNAYSSERYSKLEDKNKYNGSEATKKAQSKYLKSNKGKKQYSQYHSKLEAGIYGVYDNDKLIYIGESGQPKQRSVGHFSKMKNLKQAKINSNVCYALSIGELERVNLTFKMLEFIDDTPIRKAREKCLIQRHIPKYNDLYV